VVVVVVSGGGSLWFTVAGSAPTHLEHPIERCFAGAAVEKEHAQQMESRSAHIDATPHDASGADAPTDSLWRTAHPSPRSVGAVAQLHPRLASQATTATTVTMPPPIIRRRVETDTVVLIASKHSRGGWGLAMDKRFQESATIDRVWDASPLAQCTEIAKGVRIVAINGVDTWDRDFDGVCDLVDAADNNPAGAMQHTITRSL
jgi:hypothetical protein